MLAPAPAEEAQKGGIASLQHHRATVGLLDCLMGMQLVNLFVIIIDFTRLAFKVQECKQHALGVHAAGGP